MNPIDVIIRDLSGELLYYWYRPLDSVYKTTKDSKWLESLKVDKITFK